MYRGAGELGVSDFVNHLGTDQSVILGEGQWAQ